MQKYVLRFEERYIKETAICFIIINDCGNNDSLTAENDDIIQKKTQHVLIKT